MGINKDTFLKWWLERNEEGVSPKEAFEVILFQIVIWSLLITHYLFFM